MVIKMSEFSVSVIIPLYNVEKYIVACLESVKAQSYRNFELIVVDDGSTDKSPSLAQKCLSDFELPYQIIHQQNAGVSAARNRGIKSASGKYVVMVDADDVLHPDFLAVLINEALRCPQSDVVFCDFQVVNEQKYTSFPDIREAVVEMYTKEQAQMLFLTRKIRFLLPAMLVRRTYLTDNNIFFNEKVRYSEDVQFIWYVLSFANEKVVYVHNMLYNYILHSGSTMTASGIEKILTGCSGIQSLYPVIEKKLCDKVRYNIVPGWFFSMLHGAAKMMDYNDFCQLRKRSGYDKYIKGMFKMGDWRVSVIASALVIFPFGGYWLCKRF